MGWIAIVDKQGNNIGYVGDPVWDVMGEAFQKVIEEYEQQFGRQPTWTELMSVIEFTLPTGYQEMLPEFGNLSGFATPP